MASDTAHFTTLPHLGKTKLSGLTSRWREVIHTKVQDLLPTNGKTNSKLSSRTIIILNIL
jgi:hypothetical protein